MAYATALFPIPIPFMDIWDSGLKKMNSSSRRLRARRKLLHVAVMAFNLCMIGPLCKVWGFFRGAPAAVILEFTGG